MVVEALRGYLQLASGLTEVTRARAREAARALVAQAEALTGREGDPSAQVKALAEELATTARANRDLLLSMVRAEVERAVLGLGVASREETADLRRRLTALEARVGTPVSAAPARPARTAKAAPTGKTAPAKAAPAKQAAPAKKVAPTAKAATTAPAKTAATKAPSTKVPSTKRAAGKTSSTKTGSTKTGSTKTGSTKTGSTKTGSTKTGSTKTGSTKTGSTKTTTSGPRKRASTRRSVGGAS
jgi:hypothetical protein